MKATYQGMSIEDQEQLFAGGVKHGTLATCFWEVASGYIGPDHEAFVKAAFDRAIRAVLAEAVDEEGKNDRAITKNS